MGTTSNMSLKTIENNDYISSEPIMSNFNTVKNGPGKIFVTEVGKSTVTDSTNEKFNWSYRKWSNGYVEFWCHKHWARYSGGTADNSWLTSIAAPYPFTINNATANVSCGSTGVVDTRASYCVPGTTSVDVYMRSAARVNGYWAYFRIAGYISGESETKISLTNIAQSDYVSYSPINSNFTALDVLGKDYVIDQGNSGNWYYRKWKSGIAEAWGRWSYTWSGANDQVIEKVLLHPFKYKNDDSLVANVVAGASGRIDSGILYVNCVDTLIDTWVYKTGTTSTEHWITASVIGYLA